jgi:TolB-like protein/Tfp pilus assembly protein PilF
MFFPTRFLVGRIKQHQRSFAAGLAVLLLAAIGFGYWLYTRGTSNAARIESLAVLPFVNASGNADVEYLSDGITESLINSLSRLPKLSVKARSSVFRYKGKEVEPQQVAKELSVQAILNGRLVHRGDDLALYLSLVDARNGNQLWGERYNRKLTDLVALQSEIERDVSQKLRARLSGTDEQKLAKNYTANAEAYQLYLKGRYHALKLTPPETQKGISYFQQAIEIDPSYALAYVGLADAYRSLPIAAEMSSTELLPKAKAAAQKAIEIDDALAEAHAILGFIIFWYDWSWNAAENQYKRALELNPNSADTHLFYAHLLSETGRHAEALAEAKRARQLDPLSIYINANEGQFLIHAGQTDEGLARLQKTFELDPNYWLAHSLASSAYIEKGMFAEAVVEARKAKELLTVSTHSTAFGAYALAKSGKQAEARAMLEELLKLSTERYVPPYNIALIYNGLDERDETLAWLERGFEKRDVRMVLLKVEPKWNNLRADPRFQDLLRRVGFEP